MTALLSVKTALKTLLETELTCPVSYGAPQYADDLTASDGQLTSVWLTTPPNAGFANKGIPWMVAGAKPTTEDVRFDIVVQAIVQGKSSGQEGADALAVDMLGTVESVLASDPSLGLTSPKPVAAQVADWQHLALTPRTNAYGSRFVLTIAYLAYLPAPS